MDNQNITTLIIINVILNFIQLIDHIFSRLKSSKCWGSELQFNDNKTDIKQIDNNEILKQLKALTDKTDIKKDDPVNKL